MERRAVGRTAEVFNLDARRILKLFYPGTSLAQVEQEAAVSRAVQASGVAVPEVFEVGWWNDRPGIVYERIDGPTLLDVLLADFSTAAHRAQEMAEWHAAIHDRRAANLPNLKERLRWKIETAVGLPEPYRERAARRLDDLPDGDRLCHGDYHPDNILLTGRGAVTIDWNDATSGDPAADVARTLLLLAFSAPMEELPSEILAVRSLFALVYRNHYPPNEAQRAEEWLPVVVAARFAENIWQEHDDLLEVLATHFP